MNKKIVIKTVLSVGIAMATLLAGVDSHALNISPIPVVVSAKARYATVTVEDNGASYQARLFSWTQKDGEEVLTETNDAVVSPGVFKTPKKIRLAFPDNRDKTREITYRLVLSELVDHSALPQESVIRFQKTLDLPVFLTPSKIEKNVKHTCTDGTLTIKNEGNVHAKIVGTEAEGKESLMFYVLSGKSKTVAAHTVTLDDGKKISCK